ncbi:MAG TPA: type 4a pilus biogenesis protein PilO [Fimbriimonas sp.]|nr:type 4a pilus biogenesis protein PilO [Fimbriimonas sp.]
MINLKDPKDQTPNTLAILGFALLVGSLIITGFVKPKPEPKSKFNGKMLELKDKAIQTEADGVKYNAIIKRFRWDQKLDDVAPAALDTVTKLSKQYNLTLVSFRPQKTVDSASLIQLPFQMIVDGSFINVANFIQSLETTDSKLAVQQIQYAGQEGETDIVTANINLLAFVMKPEKPKATSTTTKQTEPTSGAKKNG